jgi:hypothetical protein
MRTAQRERQYVVERKSGKVQGPFAVGALSALFFEHPRDARGVDVVGPNAERSSPFKATAELAIDASIDR